MITVKRSDSLRSSYVRRSMEELAEMIRNGALKGDGRTKFSICFATEMWRKGGGVHVRRLNGFCLLQILNLPGMAEVEQVRSLAEVVPYTCLTFRGEDSRSLYVVTRYVWKDSGETLTEEQMRRIHANAYAQLHYTYSVQLHKSIDTVEPVLDQFCPAVCDPDAHLFSGSQAFVATPDEVNVPTYQVPSTGRLNSDAELFSSPVEAQRYQYQWAYDKAMTEARKQVVSAEWLDDACLELLAAYCHEQGLDIELCVHLTTWKKPYWGRKDYVRQVFYNAYAKELARHVPFGHVEKSALLMMRIEAYMNARYVLRRNALTGVVEYRERNAYDFGFSPLTEQDMNAMTTGALKMGLQSWDKDLRRIVNSSDIHLYDPLEDYLWHLPQWDGHDHVADLCARIPSDTPRFDFYLHTWLLSMVAHWMGKDRKHGNALVPLLIGGQGCGKTSFCNMLLPDELRVYFNDKIDFRSEGDIMSALCNYALINIDEFDSLKKSQQPILKYLLSKNDVRFRPPYGKAIVERRRYASFIATTNLQRPLKDPTGSRRFACIQIRPDEQIDFTSPIIHDQLFAQLKHEVDEGRRYWLNDEETSQLQRQNLAFQSMTSLVDVIDELFVAGDERSDTGWLNLTEITDILRRRYPGLQINRTLHRDLGWTLNQKGFARKRTNAGSVYQIRER